jgi:hypothetical protein
MAFHTFLLLLKGIRLGYALPAFKGLFAALLLLPHAISLWLKDPFVKENEDAKAYNVLCNPLSGMTLWKRIQFRLKNYKK